jgi:Zn-dependent peptidase ImmA (M78 family)
MFYSKRIEKIAADILGDVTIESLPIKVDRIAKDRGLSIKPSDLGDDVSGVLVISESTSAIGYNHKESGVRQRFTIAHELGHYELHKHQMNLFIDKKEYTVLFRDANSKEGKYKFEREANAFAAALLMPEKLVLDAINKYHFHITEDTEVKKLAKMFDVSMAAMTLRILNLNLYMRVKL